MRKNLQAFFLTFALAFALFCAFNAGKKVEAQQVVYNLGCNAVSNPFPLLDTVLGSGQHNANACYDGSGNFFIQADAIYQATGNNGAGGIVALAAGTKTVAFVSNLKFMSTPICLAQDVTTIANTVTCVPNGPPATQVVLTGTGTDTVKWIIIGNPN